MYRLSDEQAIVQTLDFFTPIVDDPYDYGAIAAANALSDCFTAGARVLTALNIVAYPFDLGVDCLRQILRGSSEKVREAGGVVLGGHTIEDLEPKFGLSVTGVVHPHQLVRNDGAKPGDALILTKKIGTGIIMNVRKCTRGARGLIGSLMASRSLVSDVVFAEAVESMKLLNKGSSELMQQANVHACTDVTGFGLLGHAFNLAEASKVALEISYSAVPKFDELEPIALRGVKGGGRRNWHWLESKVNCSPELSMDKLAILYDAQTSGPLLIAVAPSEADALVESIRSSGALATSIIGRVVKSDVPTLFVTP